MLNGARTFAARNQDNIALAQFGFVCACYWQYGASHSMQEQDAHPLQGLLETATLFTSAGYALYANADRIPRTARALFGVFKSGAEYVVEAAGLSHKSANTPAPGRR